MDSIKIQNLINYAKFHLCLNDLDELYVRNRLLEITSTLDFEENEGSIDVSKLEYADEVINPILDELVENGEIDESQREDYLCKMLDIVSLKPSEIEKKFDDLYANNKLEAFKFLHSYSIHNNYVKLSDIKKNVRWVSKNTKSELEITINLTKPEKPLSAVKAAFSAKPKYPKCVICMENIGYFGHGTKKQNLRGKELLLQNEKWFWQYSPYEYFNEHGIAINSKHTPMVINETTIPKLLDFIDYIPEYFIGCNAALPIIGGSILSHDHFQGGRYELPLFKAKPRFNFKALNFIEDKNLKVSILDWYNNVIEVKSTNRSIVEKLGNVIVKAWRNYFDSVNNIIPYENKNGFEQHSSITIITRYKDENYILDLILRNNMTDDEHPEGIYHAHKEYYNIKEEAIGLIEASGLFVLPPRLKRQLSLICDCLSGKKYDALELSNDMIIHKPMIERLIAKYGNNLSVNEANEVVRKEVNNICEKILENTAIYKNNDKDIAQFKKFLNSIDLEEIK